MLIKPAWNSLSGGIITSGVNKQQIGVRNPKDVRKSEMQKKKI